MPVSRSIRDRTRSGGVNALDFLPEFARCAALPAPKARSSLLNSCQQEFPGRRCGCRDHPTGLRIYGRRTRLWENSAGLIPSGVLALTPDGKQRPDAQLASRRHRDAQGGISRARLCGIARLLHLFPSCYADDHPSISDGWSGRSGIY